MRILSFARGAAIVALFVVPAVGQRNSVGRRYAVAAGQHEIRLFDPRYEDVVKQVTVENGKATKVSESLKPLPAPTPPFETLRTHSSDKFAAVYVNGKFMEHADEFSNGAQGLLLNPGEYVVKIVPVNATDGKEKKLEIEAGKTTGFRDR